MRENIPAFMYMNDFSRLFDARWPANQENQDIRIRKIFYVGSGNIETEGKFLFPTA